MKPPLVAHLIYSLSTGGLENGLVNIINRLPRGAYRHVIICITSADEFAARITAQDVQVIQMHKREGHDWRFYLRLRRLLRELRPDIVHSRNLAALEAQLCGLGLGARRLHGEHGREVGDLDGSNRKYLLLRRCMRFFMHHYIAVSRDLERWLVERVGVRAARVTQIYNGVDHRRFSPGSVKPLALLPQQWREAVRSYNAGEWVSEVLFTKVPSPADLAAISPPSARDLPASSPRARRRLPAISR